MKMLMQCYPLNLNNDNRDMWTDLKNEWRCICVCVYVSTFLSLSFVFALCSSAWTIRRGRYFYGEKERERKRRTNLFLLLLLEGEKDKRSVLNVLPPPISLIYHKVRKKRVACYLLLKKLNFFPLLSFSPFAFRLVLINEIEDIQMTWKTTER